MAKTLKEGKFTYWVDSEGAKVPVKHVSAEDKERDSTVEEVCAHACKLHAIVKGAKTMIQEKLSSYLNELAEKYGEKWQGNARIRNYSHTMEVEVSMAKLITFDETIAIAKTKIDNCISSWTPGAKTEIITLVNQAFNVNQKNQLQVKELLRLLRMGITDPVWLEAMEIIKNSIVVAATKQYLNFRVKGEDGTWTTIPLNFSSI